MLTRQSLLRHAKERHSKHCSITYPVCQPRSYTVKSLSRQQSRQRAPQPGTGCSRTHGAVPGTRGPATLHHLHGSPPATAHNTAHQPQLALHAARSLLWEKWITSVFPREQRPASLPAREDSNQLIEAATITVMALHERHLQVLFLCTSSCRSSSSSHQRRSNLTCLCESSPYRVSAIWLIRNFL